jgi:hypothetical protein
MSKIQEIRRARVIPFEAEVVEAPEWFRRFMLSGFVPLAQQAKLLNDAIQRLNVPVAGGALTTTVKLAFPYPDIDYGFSLTPSWMTMPWVAPGDVAVGSFKVTYGVIAPPGGGTLYVVTVR